MKMAIVHAEAQERLFLIRRPESSFWTGLVRRVEADAVEDARVVGTCRGVEWLGAAATFF
jgi:hypothetical protein